MEERFQKSGLFGERRVFGIGHSGFQQRKGL
jgi:hypothetical protein